MTKKIVISFSDDDYEMSVNPIALERAQYYADVDVPDRNTKEQEAEWQQVFMDEYNYTMSNDFEIIDWVRNNTHYDDIKPYLKKLNHKETDHRSEFMLDNINFRIENE